MTDLEQEITHYFLQADTINDDLSSHKLPKPHIPRQSSSLFY